jgi:hypothetical protein
MGKILIALVFILVFWGGAIYACATDAGAQVPRPDPALGTKGKITSISSAVISQKFEVTMYDEFRAVTATCWLRKHGKIRPCTARWKQPTLVPVGVHRFPLMKIDGEWHRLAITVK